MPAAIPQAVAASPAHLVSPTTPYKPVSNVATWFTATTAASLTGASRADQLTDPVDVAASGEYAFDPEGSVAAFKFLIRGAASAISRGNVYTANLWEWSCISDPKSAFRQWTPTLVGRFTLTFNGSGVAGQNTLGVALGPILATDLYCSNIAVVSGYDRRGDYALRYKIMQPTADDGSPAVLLVDGLSGNRFTWEGRSTTNGDAWMVLARWLPGV